MDEQQYQPDPDQIFQKSDIAVQELIDGLFEEQAQMRRDSQMGVEYAPMPDILARLYSLIARTEHVPEARAVLRRYGYNGVLVPNQKIIPHFILEYLSALKMGWKKEMPI